MVGSETISVSVAVAALLSGSMSVGLNLRRQRADRRTNRVPRRSDRITLWIEVVLLTAIAGALVWALID